MTGTRWGRLGGLAVAVVAVAVTVSLVRLGSVPTRLLATDPADGAVLDAAPAQVSLTFTGLGDPQAFHVNVGDGTGAAVTDGAARLSGQTITVPVRIASPGRYLVAYHVVLGDGREVSGTTRFSVTAVGAVPAAPGSPPASGTDALGHQHDGVDAASLVVLVLDAALIVFLVALLLRRPRRDRTTQDDPRTPAG